MTCVHFIGFDPKDTVKFYRAVQVFGQPDFVHRYWDARAAHGGEYAPGDVRVFATGTDQDPPRVHAYDDSAYA